jgi:hypothetical protein
MSARCLWPSLLVYRGWKICTKANSQSFLLIRQSASRIHSLLTQQVVYKTWSTRLCLNILPQTCTIAMHHTKNMPPVPKTSSQFSSSPLVCRTHQHYRQPSHRHLRPRPSRNILSGEGLAIRRTNHRTHNPHGGTILPF